MTDDLAPFDRTAFFARLREATPARIGLGRSGTSIATRDHLAFALAHAQARDAVHDALDVETFMRGLQALSADVVRVTSEAVDRATYLARPDLGRRLDVASRERLAACVRCCDIAIVVADGLSARAVSAHVTPVLARLLPLCAEQRLTAGTIAIAEQGRVAIGDEIGALLGARIVCVLIGERPGLSSPDSLGIYITLAPAPGRTDAERNCISNVRADGMSYDEAARRCAWLIAEALRRGATGVTLKDEYRAETALPRDPRFTQRESSESP